VIRPQPKHIVIIGAGAAGLMAARELGRAGRKVTILEARDRCGGRIHPLTMAQFGYEAEAGAEFIHGEAPVTRGLVQEAGLSLQPVEGARWNVQNGAFSQEEPTDIHAESLHQALAELQSDMTVTEFLRQHFAAPEYERLRRSILRMVEGYDAADPARASMLALRDEWMNSGRASQARIAEGYGAMIGFLVSECRQHGAVLHLGAAVSAIEDSNGGVLVRCADGRSFAGDAAILTVPLPLLEAIALPPALRQKTAMAAAGIGFGNVIKLLLRFKRRWWIDASSRDLSDLLFLISDRTVPVWWTQRPADHAVLTGWLAGPPTKGFDHLDERALIEAGLTSLAEIFALTPEQLQREVVVARAINWADDPFARGAYSYATPDTRLAQAALEAVEGAILFSGEALYRGRDMGTVEAALTSGQEAARKLLGG
jgi:monoamine oxidase